MSPKFFQRTGLTIDQRLGKQKIIISWKGFHQYYKKHSEMVVSQPSSLWYVSSNWHYSKDENSDFILTESEGKGGSSYGTANKKVLKGRLLTPTITLEKYWTQDCSICNFNRRGWKPLGHSTNHSWIRSLKLDSEYKALEEGKEKIKKLTCNIVGEQGVEKYEKILFINHNMSEMTNCTIDITKCLIWKLDLTAKIVFLVAGDLTLLWWILDKLNKFLSLVNP